MKASHILIATAALFAAGCNKDKAAPVDGGGDAPAVTAAPVPAPNNGDWATVVKATPEGGYVMGNPNAKVKLVEYGSMTCPHCREFDETGVKPLIDNYVKKGLVSWEFRNFVRDPIDMTASILAQCGGEASFFGLTRSLYADQPEWFAKIQAGDQSRLQAIQNAAPAVQFTTVADMAGFLPWAAQRGLPRDQAQKCLADPALTDKLVKVNADAISQYNLPGTPTFLINGNVVQDTATWEKLEPAIKRALAD
nr:thioredoxin domain-containing protein [uncultured Sphingomonas sp.]